MNYYLSERGFWQTDAIAGIHGRKIRVYESSGVTPSVWLTVDDATPEEVEDGMQRNYVLLSLEQVDELIEALQEISDNHFSKQ